MNLEKIKYFLVGVLGAIFIRLLFSTISIREIPNDYSQKLKRQGKCVIFAIWHAHILAAICPGRKLSVKVLISQHRDGEYIAQIIQRLGYGVARGSTTRGGARALLNMIKEVKEEAISLAITPDGPKGPRFVAQSGAIILGQKTGYPILPVTIHMTKYWELPSWDRFRIPKPFSKAMIIYGDSLTIPSKLEKPEIEEYRELLEKVLIKTGNEGERMVKGI